MSEDRNRTNIGEQIRDSVTEALRTGNFNILNDLVNDAVNTALQEAKVQSALERERQKERVKKQHEDWQVHKDDLSEKEWGWQQRERERLDEERARQQEWQRLQEEKLRQERARREELKRQHERQQEEFKRQQEQWQRERQQLNAQLANQKNAKKAAKSLKQLVKIKRVGSVSGVLLIVFGSIGLGMTALSSLMLIFSLILGLASWGRAIAALVMIAIFLGMIFSGISQRKRLTRAEKYMQLCGYKMYGVLEELAKQTGKSLRYVRRDIRKMLHIGIFPEGHLDEKETCVMLNDEIFNQYLQTAEAHRQAEEQQRMEEEAKNAPKSAAEQAAEEQRARDEELNTMVAEGRESIRKLRELNDDIPGEGISERLSQLEGLLNEIFERVQEHPEQMHRMHKLMEYYLPTTVKLVEAYAEFDKVSAPGEDIISAKAEIEKTLGIINQAFQELLNTLFQDAAMDATTDAQVLQSMLAREGLTKDMEVSNAKN